MQGRVLIVAGSDSGGGAGIQADIKAVTALGGYAATAVTALTAQNTLGVHGVLPVPPEFIRQQFEVVIQDIGADCLKTGMLHDAEVIETVCDAMRSVDPVPVLVADPVMVAKGGAPLLDPGGIDALRQHLLPLATVLTPNIPEAEVLTGMTIRTLADMKEAAEGLRDMGPRNVLVKGGHLTGERLHDVLLDDAGLEVFEIERVPTVHTHGTGCTLASAIAVSLAQELSIRQSVARAQAYVIEAIRRAPGLGGGHGPLDHAHTLTAPGRGGPR